MLGYYEKLLNYIWVKVYIQMTHVHLFTIEYSPCYVISLAGPHLGNRGVFTLWSFIYSQWKAEFFPF